MVKFAAHQLFLLYIDGHICTSKRQKRDLFFISFYFVLVGHRGWREEDGRRMTISPHLVRFVLHGRNTPLALLIYSLILIKICIFFHAMLICNQELTICISFTSTYLVLKVLVSSTVIARQVRNMCKRAKCSCGVGMTKSTMYS